MGIKEKTWERIIQSILLILIASGIGILFFLNGNNGPEMPMGPGGGQPPRGAPQTVDGSTAVAVETYEIVRTDVYKTIRVNGDVTTESSVAIYSDTDGRLSKLTVGVGDMVSKDTIIAYVDPSLPGQDYSLSPVRSTITGTVTTLPLNLGDKVTTQAPLATVGDLTTLKITSYIPERFISSLKLGLQADVLFDAYPDERFKAVVTEISPIMDIETRTVEITFVLTQKDERIRPGMFASLYLITEESTNTLAVPAQAILTNYDEKSVYVINAENRAERKIIETGLTTDEIVEVISGLTEGDHVITQGLSKITEGTTVRSVSGETNK